MAFSKQLEEVIEAALADGVITEKERAVLHKKALQEGVDPDEVDVVIDGRLQQMQNEVDKAKQKVRKCPSCGEIIPAMTAVCPSCGQVIDTSNPDNKALLKYMDKLEATLVELKEEGSKNFDHKVRAELEGMVRQGKALYGDNKKINYLISEVEASIADFEKKYKNKLRAKIGGLILCVLIVLGIIFSIYNHFHQANVQEAEMIETLKAQIDQQYNDITSTVNSLPSPNKENYDECAEAVRKISWNEVDSHDLYELREYQDSKRKDAGKNINKYIDKLHQVELPYINPETGKQTTESQRDHTERDHNGKIISRGWRDNEHNPKYVIEYNNFTNKF